MEITKNKWFHLSIGCLSFVLLILSLLLLVKTIPSVDKLLWVWAILLICFAINLVEMVIYFMFGNGDISLMLCKWLNMFIGAILFIISAIGMVFAIINNAGIMSYLVIGFTLVLVVLMIAYFVFAIKEAKKEKQPQEN